MVEWKNELNMKIEGCWSKQRMVKGVQPVAELVELSVRQSVDGREVTLNEEQIQSGTLKRSPSKRLAHQVPFPASVLFLSLLFSHASPNTFLLPLPSLLPTHLPYLNPSYPFRPSVPFSSLSQALQTPSLYPFPPL
ncbi:hypothetical protein Pmani_002880 [Petrolisthes manimaculis]|uniref:Uncharacterized protein n=1 Tax=Petrolisthes manimaculis TaxID=1843537 RepID=A0AAE1UJ03_9EUCA|nr:hypothetical protein Pmani_002880 [Petrolisthes manimaculis]